MVVVKIYYVVPFISVVLNSDYISELYGELLKQYQQTGRDTEQFYLIIWQEMTVNEFIFYKLWQIIA